jgi:flagellar FliL protein
VDIKGLFKNLPKKLITKKVIVIVAMVFIILFIAIIVVIFFLKSDNNADIDSQPDVIKLTKVDYKNILTLKPFVWIALNKDSYMSKVSIDIALELVSNNKIKIVKTRQNDIRKIVRNIAGEMRWMELRSPEGKIKFKYMLIRKINSLFPDIIVRNLYLTHFIMR